MIIATDIDCQRLMVQAETSSTEKAVPLLYQ